MKYIGSKRKISKDILPIITKNLSKNRFYVEPFCGGYGFDSNIGYISQYPFPNPCEAFAVLIDKVSGKGTWESNPYVFVYDFELVD